jgi:oligo-1,6-glucosidase
VYLGNHDQARMVSRWGHDDPAYRVRSSKMLTTFILTMRGTPYYLAGDELGMTSIKFDDVSDYRDIYTLNTYKRLSSQSAEAAAAYLEAQKIYGRDNSRTPFQWDGSRNAGFTTGTPWIKINPDFASVNAENAEQDPASTLHYFRDLIRLRKAEPALIYGAYHLLDENNPQVYAYTRSLGDEVFLILLNFSSQDAQVDLGALCLDTATRVMGNYVEENTKRNLLRPCESVIYFLDLLRGVGEVGKKRPF